MLPWDRQVRGLSVDSRRCRVSPVSYNVLGNQKAGKLVCAELTGRVFLSYKIADDALPVLGQ
jgi:hypothetical protein